MIEKVRIKNLQVHEDLTIEFGPTVTTIVGPTNAGKSTVIRGLTLLALNRRPKGTYQRTGKPTVVSAKVDGQWVSRGAGKSHWYKVEGKRLRAAGKRGEVPKAVKDLFNAGPANFQRQRDPAFWFSDSPGQVSKALNAIVDLGVIDRCTANAAARVRKAAAEVEVSEGRLTDLKARKESLRWAVGNADRVAELERLFTKYRNLRKTGFSLRHRIRGVRNHYRLSIVAGRAKNHGEKCLTAARALLVACRKEERLETLVRKAKEVRAVRPPPDLQPLLAVRAEADRVADACSTLEHLVTRCREAEEMKCRLEKNLARSRKLLAAVKTCPLCNRPFGRK